MCIVQPLHVGMGKGSAWMQMQACVNGQFVTPVFLVSGQIFNELVCCWQASPLTAVEPKSPLAGSALLAASVPCFLLHRGCCATPSRGSGRRTQSRRQLTLGSIWRTPAPLRCLAPCWHACLAESAPSCSPPVCGPLASAMCASSGREGGGGVMQRVGPQLGRSSIILQSQVCMCQEAHV